MPAKMGCKKHTILGEMHSALVRSSKLALAIGCLVACALSPTAAQTYPVRPITLIVPFAAGGAADLNGRIIAEGLTQRLGQPVVVENVAGAGGTTGTIRGKSAQPDGHTILLGHMGTQAASVGLYPKLGYDPRTDFEPIGMISFSPIIVFSRANLPVNGLREFLAYAKQQNEKITDGHSGVGSISHITCALLASLGGYKPTFVPFRGVGPMVNDMLGGNIDFGCDLVLAVSQQVVGGKLKGIAVAARERSAAVPGVETSVEGGLPEFQANAWTGLFAPKGTPPATLQKLREALIQSLDDSRTQERLVGLGAVVPKQDQRTAAYLAKTVNDEVDRWSKVIKDAGITVE